jgi:hypothetical protein
MRAHRIPLRLLFVMFLIVGLPACEAYKSQLFLNWTQIEARGIQPVRAKPPTLGYKRLHAHAGLNTAVKLFLQAKGYPDYIIEVPSFLQVRIVCYYTGPNQAYFLQSTGNHASSIRILGPEPIGEKDKKLFKALEELERAASAYNEEPPS